VCPLPPPVLGEEAHSLAREGLGESKFRRGDIHCGTLYICMYVYVLCAPYPTTSLGCQIPDFIFCCFRPKQCIVYNTSINFGNNKSSLEEMPKVAETACWDLGINWSLLVWIKSNYWWWHLLMFFVFFFYAFYLFLLSVACLASLSVYFLSILSL
jgi:hypothetical protein